MRLLGEKMNKFVLFQLVLVVINLVVAVKYNNPFSYGTAILCAYFAMTLWV